MVGSESLCPPPPTGLLRSTSAATTLTQEVLRACLASAVRTAGSQGRAAVALGITRSYLSELISGRRKIGRSLVERLPALGMAASSARWLGGLLRAPAPPGGRPAVGGAEERLRELRLAYERQFSHTPGAGGNVTALTEIPTGAAGLAIELSSTLRASALLQVEALLLRSYAQVLVGEAADALWCALCAQQLGLEALGGQDRTFALARAAIARSQAYLVLGLGVPHWQAATDVLAAAAELPPRVASGIPIAGHRAHLGGLLARRRPSIAEVRWHIAKIEEHVDRGHCRPGDGGLELLLSYPLAMQAAVARGNRLNLRWAERLTAQGRELLAGDGGALGPVPRLIFLEASAGALHSLGDRTARRETLAEIREIAQANGMHRPAARAEALLAE